MRLILVGPPGAGKGTQAVHLASHFSIPHISTGDIFRLNIKGETKLGLHAKSFMDAGNLVPDSVTNDMVADRLTHADAKGGFLLDGYPRNIGQADFLKENLENSGTPLDAVLEFKLENAEIIKRLSGRRACRNRPQPLCRHRAIGGRRRASTGAGRPRFRPCRSILKTHVALRNNRKDRCGKSRCAALNMRETNRPLMR